MHPEIEDAKVGLLGLPLLLQNLGNVDHAERQVGGISHWRLFDSDEVLKAPVLLGIARVELNGMITVKCCTSLYQ